MYYHITFHNIFTLSIVSFTLVWLGVDSNKVETQDFNNGITDMMMSIDMNREQIGSAINHPSCSINIEDNITPTLPIVSASICRNIPV